MVLYNINFIDIKIICADDNTITYVYRAPQQTHGQILDLNTMDLLYISSHIQYNIM